MKKTINDKVEVGKPVKREESSAKILIMVVVITGIIAIIFMAHLSQKRFRETMIFKTQQHLLAVAKATAKNIEEFTARHLLVLKFIARNPLFHEQGHQYGLLKNLYGNYEEDVDAICLVDSNGYVLYRYPYWKDTIDRKGCLATEQSEIIYASREREPYSKVTYNKRDKLAMFLSVPMSDKGKFSGILRWMISMDTISEHFIQPIKVGQKGYGWLLDNNKMILAHPDSKHIGASYITLKSEKAPYHDWTELENIVERMVEGEEGVGVYHSLWSENEQLERARILTAFTPVHIGNNLWSINISMNYDEITGPINKNGFIILTLSGLIILLFSTGGVILFRTERRKVELTAERRHLQQIAESAEALLESEKRYRILVETIPDGIQEIDRHGIITYANDAHHRMFGYSQGELLGKSIFDFVAQDSDQKKLRNYVEKALKEQTNTNPWEGEVLTKKGRTIDVRAHWNYDRDDQGRIRGFISIVSDITSQKKAKEALEKSHVELERRVRERTNELVKEKNYTESILRAMVDTLIVVGPENKIRVVNDATLKLLGYKQEELIEQNLCNILVDGMGEEQFEELIEQNRPVNVETYFMAKNGRKIPILFSASAIRSRKGNIKNIVCTGKDITELKNLEKSLLNFQDRLRTLASKQLSLQEQERKKISLELHDDLGQSLTAVLIDIAHAESQSRQRDCECVGFLDRILKGTEEALQRVRNIASDLRPGVLDSVGLQAAVESLLEDFRERTGINVIEETNIENDDISEAVTIAIYRILQESLTNAVKYSEAKKITVKLMCHNNRISLSVADDGQGFDTGVSLKEKGMGLLGMKERTEWLNGVFKIESVIGRGTKICVEIPLSSQGKEAYA